MERKDAKARPTKVDGKKFKCPKCGCNRLEEVMRDVTQSSVISVVEGEAADYENTSTDGQLAWTVLGEVDRIQCLECGAKVASTYDELGEMAKGWKK